MTIRKILSYWLREHEARISGKLGGKKRLCNDGSSYSNMGESQEIKDGYRGIENDKVFGDENRARF